MDLDKKAFYYSFDEKITPLKLKNLENLPEFDYQKIENYLKRYDINFMMEWINQYHYKFSLIKSRPYILYYIWDITILEKKIIWIVWPRKISIYGEKILEKFFEKISWYDLCIVSWLAEWVDQYAHKLSMKYWLPTIAVLGWWLWYYLKSRDRSLIKQIISNWWLVLSEFKLDFKPTNYSFPQRNRIIAWLGDLLFVPEAGKNSGSLITVDFALMMSKKVFGTPNNIFDTNSLGLNEYISKSKITAINDLQSFIDENFAKVPQKNIVQNEFIIETLSASERKIYFFIFDKKEVDLNTISISLDMSLTEIMINVSNLEISWFIEEKYPGIYSIK